VLLRFPAGLSLVELRNELSGSIQPPHSQSENFGTARRGRIHRRGEGRATRYLHGAAPEDKNASRFSAKDETSGALPAASASAPATRLKQRTFETPDVCRDDRPLAGRTRQSSSTSQKPAAARTPRGYERRVLDGYVPNQTAYIPDKLKVHLHKIGKPIVADASSRHVRARHTHAF